MSFSEKFPHDIKAQPDAVWKLPSGSEVPFFDLRQCQGCEMIQYRRADTCDACDEERAVVAVVKDCIKEDWSYLVDFVCRCCGHERVNVIEMMATLEQFECFSSRDELPKSTISNEEIKRFMHALEQDEIVPGDF